MDFKQFLIKPKDKNVISDRNHPSSYFQKRLEAFLKTSPFKKGSINPVFSQENIEKLKQSLIPVMIMKTIVKLSVFNSIKHHKTITNKLQKGHYLIEWKELQSKIEFLKQKPCDFLVKTLENSEENFRNKKLLEVILKRNRINAFYSEKIRSYFHSWRLLAFENGLRKISIHHSEIIQKQILDQLNNIYIAVVKPTMQNGFRAIKEGSMKKSRKTKKNENRREKIKFGVIMLQAVVRERISGLLLVGFEMIREGVDLRKAGFLKQKMQKEFKNRSCAMGLKIIRNIFKIKKTDAFLVLKNNCAMRKNQNEKSDNFRLLGLKIVGKILENKIFLIKKAVIYQMSEFLVYARQRSSLLNQVLTKFTNKTKRKYLHRWDLISMKMKDPLICTKQRISNHPPAKKSKSMSFLKLNKQIIVNQALVNAALEVEQKKKNEKLLKINQNLGLIEIETLIERKRKLYSRVFLNNLTILGTFEAKRYQEFEHYLKILQEEKVFNNFFAVLKNVKIFFPKIPYFKKFLFVSFLTCRKYYTMKLKKLKTTTKNSRNIWIKKCTQSGVEAMVQESALCLPPMKNPARKD